MVYELRRESAWTNYDQILLMCAARTLAGSLVPLKGDAPTNVGFENADYDRFNGITGDGASYINTNYAGTWRQSASQQHIWITQRQEGTTGDGQPPYLCGGSFTQPKGIYLRYPVGGPINGYGVNPGAGPTTAGTNSTYNASMANTSGFCGWRATSIDYFALFPNNGTTGIGGSTNSGSAPNIFIFAANNGSGAPIRITTSRLCCYGIGIQVTTAVGGLPIARDVFSRFRTRLQVALGL